MWRQIMAQWQQIWAAQSREIFFSQTWVLVMFGLAAASLLWRRWSLCLLIILITFTVQAILTMVNLLSWSDATAYNILVVGVFSLILILGFLSELFVSGK